MNQKVIDNILNFIDESCRFYDPVECWVDLEVYNKPIKEKDKIHIKVDYSFKYKDFDANGINIDRVSLIKESGDFSFTPKYKEDVDAVLQKVRNEILNHCKGYFNVYPNFRLINNIDVL